MFDNKISKARLLTEKSRQNRARELEEYENLSAMPTETGEQVEAYKKARDDFFKKYPR